MRLVDAEYVKAVMLNDRLMQGNAEFTLYAQQVETQVNALPSIDIVFCKDCKHRPYCCRGDIPVNGNGFCSDGERSE